MYTKINQVGRQWEMAGLVASSSGTQVESVVVHSREIVNRLLESLVAHVAVSGRDVGDEGRLVSERREVQLDGGVSGLWSIGETVEGEEVEAVVATQLGASTLNQPEDPPAKRVLGGLN